VGVGGEDDPFTYLAANRAGLLRLRKQVEAALAAAEGYGVMIAYQQADGRRFDLVVQ
jgi:hypothetical protein